MKIDLQAAITTTEELLSELRQLDGTELDDLRGRAAQRRRGHINRTLLRLSHECDRASVQVMDAYFAFKDADNPAGEPEPDER
jgi:hypothetical protein